MQLADYLEENNITQADFANELGVTQSAVSHWVSGRFQVSGRSMWERIERATGGLVTRSDLRPDIFDTEYRVKKK